MATPVCPVKPSDFADCIVTSQDSLGTAIYKTFLRFPVMLYLFIRWMFNDYARFSCNFRKMACAALQECNKADFYDCDDDVIVPPSGDTACRAPILDSAVYVVGTAGDDWVECRWTLPTSKFISVSLERYDASIGEEDPDYHKEWDITNLDQPYRDTTIVSGHTYRYNVKLYCSFTPPSTYVVNYSPIKEKVIP